MLLDNKTSTGSSRWVKERRGDMKVNGGVRERRVERDRSMEKGHTHCGRGKVEKEEEEEEEEILLGGVLAM